MRGSHVARDPQTRECRTEMNNLQIICRMCEMLDQAQRIIRRQAEILDMHGIKTEDGELETKRAQLLENIDHGP